MEGHAAWKTIRVPQFSPLLAFFDSRPGGQADEVMKLILPYQKVGQSKTLATHRLSSVGILKCNSIAGCLFHIGNGIPLQLLTVQL